MKILFINLADYKHLGIRTVNALRRKYHDENDNVVLLNLLPIALAFKNDRKIYQRPTQISKVFSKRMINQFDKIMLAAHGEIDDYKHCYYDPDTYDENQTSNDKKYRILFDTAESTEFIMFLTKFLRKKLHLSLIICYGGRPKGFEKTSITSATRNEFASLSFLGLIVTELYSRGFQYPVKITGRTGRVTADENTGRILVETEQSILNQAARRELSIQINIIKNKIIVMSAELETSGGDEITIADEDNTSTILDDVDDDDVSDGISDQQASNDGRGYHGRAQADDTAMQNLQQEFETLFAQWVVKKSAIEFRPKYGKITFYGNMDDITIDSKYSAPDITSIVRSNNDDQSERNRHNSEHDLEDNSSCCGIS